MHRVHYPLLPGSHELEIGRHVSVGARPSRDRPGTMGQDRGDEIPMVVQNHAWTHIPVHVMCDCAYSHLNSVHPYRVQVQAAGTGMFVRAGEGPTTITGYMRWWSTPYLYRLSHESQP